MSELEQQLRENIDFLLETLDMPASQCKADNFQHSVYEISRIHNDMLTSCFDNNLLSRGE